MNVSCGFVARPRHSYSGVESRVTSTPLAMSAVTLSPPTLRVRARARLPARARVRFPSPPPPRPPRLRDGRRHHDHRLVHRR